MSRQDDEYFCLFLLSSCDFNAFIEITDREDPNRTTTCKFTHFYCNDSGATVFYLDRNKQVCDGTEDCASGVDECQDCTQGVFSSDEDLISAKPLVPFLWIVSTLAVLGNIAVIISAISALSTKRRRLSKNETLQRILVTNLSTADLLVAVYTTGMCFSNLILSSDRYCLHDHSWRSGIGCSIFGAIVVVGSEASVFAMIIITVVRFNAVNRIMKPFSTRTLGVLIAIAWLLSLFIAILPVLPFTEDYFIESVWFKENAFGKTMDLEEMPHYTERMLASLKIEMNSSFVTDNGGIGSWDLFEALMRKMNPAYVVERRFGYYSTHGVCLPRLFPKKHEDASWGFSLTVILINFFGFLFILVGYIMIYKKATKVTVSQESAAKRGEELQVRLTRIVATDFCCWIPICVMAFLQLSGIEIHKEVYVPAGTILIPINSALNPFMYSDRPAWLWDKLSPFRGWIRARLAAAWQKVGICKKGEKEIVELQELAQANRRGRDLPFAAVEQMVVEVEVEEELEEANEGNQPGRDLPFAASEQMMEVKVHVIEEQEEAKEDTDAGDKKIDDVTTSEPKTQAKTDTVTKALIIPSDDNECEENEQADAGAVGVAIEEAQGNKDESEMAEKDEDDVDHGTAPAKGDAAVIGGRRIDDENGRVMEDALTDDAAGGDAKTTGAMDAAVDRQTGKENEGLDMDKDDGEVDLNSGMEEAAGKADDHAEEEAEESQNLLGGEEPRNEGKLEDPGKQYAETKF